MVLQATAIQHLVLVRNLLISKRLKIKQKVSIIFGHFLYLKRIGIMNCKFPAFLISQPLCSFSS